MSKQIKVLLADDDDSIAKLYTIYLQTKNYIVERAHNGIEALELVDSFQPDIILLDIMMPQKSGLEVLKELKSNQTTKNIPVVMFTAISQDHEKKQAHELGAKGYVVKSQIVMSDVATIIQNNL